MKALALATIVHRKQDGTERVGISHFGAGLAKAAFSQSDDFHQGVFFLMADATAAYLPVGV